LGKFRSGKEAAEFYNDFKPIESCKKLTQKMFPTKVKKMSFTTLFFATCVGELFKLVQRFELSSKLSVYSAFLIPHLNFFVQIFGCPFSTFWN
jgi:hypothetical protein